MEQNKTGKYLKYAIGEIVLVIIGILLALQINDWNTKRIEINTLKSNLNYVLEDIEKDKNQLVGLKKQRQEAVRFCVNFIESYLQNKPISFDPKKKNPDLFLYERKFIRNLQSFKKVESSELFEAERYYALRERIDAYAEAIDRLVYDEERLNYFIEENERAMIQNGSMVRMYEYERFVKSFSDGKTPNIEIDWLEILKENSAFKGILLRFEDDMIRLIIPQYGKTVAIGEELRLEIQSYLNQK